MAIYYKNVALSDVLFIYCNLWIVQIMQIGSFMTTPGVCAYMRVCALHHMWQYILYNNLYIFICVFCMFKKKGSLWKLYFSIY